MNRYLYCKVWWKLTPKEPTLKLVNKLLPIRLSEYDTNRNAAAMKLTFNAPKDMAAEMFEDREALKSISLRGYGVCSVRWSASKEFNFYSSTVAAVLSCQLCQS